MWCWNCLKKHSNCKLILKHVEFVWDYGRVLSFIWHMPLPLFYCDINIYQRKLVRLFYSPYLWLNKLMVVIIWSIIVKLYKKSDADGIHNIHNKLIRYYCITLFLIKVIDIIEILKYVYMGILLLIHVVTYR